MDSQINHFLARRRILWRENDLMPECKSAKSPTHYPSITTGITVSYYIFSI